MSASEEMRASVQELMAQAERLFPGQNASNVNITNMCYAYAVGACPAELLYGTKFSLGKCKWSHDKFVKNSIPSSEIGRVELGALRVIESALEKLNRLERKHRKEFNYHADLQLVKGEHDTLLKEEETRYAKEIDLLLQEARRFGEQERIDEALEVMENVNQTQKRLQAVIAKIKRRQETDARRRTLLKLEVNVCDQCGIAFGLDSTANRHQAHLEGKLHNSVCILRQTAGDLRAKYSLNVRSSRDTGITTREMRPSLVSTLREDYERDYSDF